MAKKLLTDTSFFDEGDIIDRIAKEQEVSKKEENTFNLNNLIDYYHKSLFNNEDAFDYLNRKGIKNQEIYSRFKIGYADGNLQSLLSKKQIEELKKLNIINNDGDEILLDNVIVPLLDLNDNVVDIFGINIVDDSIKSIFNNQGIYNIKATKVYDEIILTDSVTTCLGLIGNGFENVIAVKDNAYIIDENIKILRDNRVKIIIINFNDSDLIKDLLIKEGFKVKMMKFVKTSDKEEMQLEIDDAELSLIDKDHKNKLTVTRDDYKYIFRVKDITYTVTGVKEVFVSNLRVSIRAELDDEWFPDNIDLYSARSRSSFSVSISKKFNIEEKRIENDLLKILDYFEEERDRILKSNNEEDEEEVLTEDERQTGLNFFRYIPV